MNLQSIRFIAFGVFIVFLSMYFLDFVFNLSLTEYSFFYYLGVVSWIIICYTYIRDFIKKVKHEA